MEEKTPFEMVVERELSNYHRMLDINKVGYRKDRQITVGILKPSAYDVYFSFVKQEKYPIQEVKKEQTVFGCTIDGLLIGSSVVDGLHETEKEKWIVDIGRFLFQYKARRTGLADYLLFFIIKEASDQGKSSIYTDVLRDRTGSKKFYKNNGFSVIDDRKERSVRMRLKLNDNRHKKTVPVFDESGVIKKYPRSLILKNL